jgi:carotenoid cleavage dioxygenase-like enzyme
LQLESTHSRIWLSGKMHRFVLDGDKKTVCYSGRIMPTGFFNASKKANTIGHGILFSDTTPPRKKCLEPLCNLLAPNDNVFVNNIKLGNTFLSLSDTANWFAFDPATMDTFTKHKMNSLSPSLYMGALGPAHPLVRPGSDQLVSMVSSCPMMGNQSAHPAVSLFTVDPSNPNTRKLLLQYSPAFAPYVHSFGIHKDYALVVHQPVSINMTVIEKTGLLGDAFVDFPGRATQIYMIP